MIKHRSSVGYRLLPICAVLLLGACSEQETSTKNEIHYNMISLSESATRSVVKDEMTVELMIMEEGRNPVALTRGITEKINRLLKATSINTASGNQAPTPEEMTVSLTNRYSQRIKRGLWQETATIRIVGTDSSGINQYIEKNQDIARIQGVSFAVSRQTKVKTENELTAEALKRLQDRGRLVAQSMGLSKFRIVNMNIGTQTTRPLDDGNHFPFAYATEMAVTEEAPADVAEQTAAEPPIPQFAAEKQDLNLSVQAQIQLY